MFIGRCARILCKKIPIGLRSLAAILKKVARKWRKISKLSELNETQYLGYFGDGEQDEAIEMAATSTWPPRATSAIARNCSSSCLLLCRPDLSGTTYCYSSVSLLLLLCRPDLSGTTYCFSSVSLLLLLFIILLLLLLLLLLPMDLVRA